MIYPSWDADLFFLINQWDLPPMFDWLLTQWRNAVVWIPLYIFLITYLIWRFKKHGWILVIGVILCTGFSDFTNSSLLKKTFERPRPCFTFSDSESLHLKVRCGSGYSFPSSHASNHMALALFLFLSAPSRIKSSLGVLIPWAFIVGLAQVYVGVHYPFDVMLGFIWGSVVALAFSRLWKAFFLKETIQ